jgi:probable addiction module antidote protein
MAKAQIFDVAEFLDDPEVVAHYLTEAVGTGDVREIASALGDVWRARGMTELAKTTGMSREHLYRALSQDGNPEFSTVFKALDALGMHLEVKAGSAA